MPGSFELDEALFWSDWKRANPPRSTISSDGEPYEYRSSPVHQETAADMDRFWARAISAFDIKWAAGRGGRAQARRTMPINSIDTRLPMILNIIVHMDDGHTVEISTEARELQYVGPEIAAALVERGIETYERLEVVVEKGA